MLAFFVVYDILVSNYDLQNLMFVLNSWQYFKIQFRIGQLQLISSKCCPALPEAWAQANAGAQCGALVDIYDEHTKNTHDFP